MTGMMISTSTANLTHGQHCGNYHTGQCRLIKAISVIPSEGIRVMDAWDVLGEAIGTVSAPSDWASQHDHYLYGTPKHESDETPSARVIAAINELESGGGEVFASWEDEAENEIELNSPNWLGELFTELRQRGFKRINDSRRKANE